MRVAANSPAVVRYFNRRSECYEKESQKNDLTRKITPNELQIIEKELMQHLPSETVENILINVFLKLTEGTNAADNYDAYVSGDSYRSC